jgi:pyruvyl transferase EpsI
LLLFPIRLFGSASRRAAEALEFGLARMAAEATRAGRRKILYGITPPRSLSNVGDQAQAVAIHRWFRRYFPEFAVVELDKDLSARPLPRLRREFGEGDLVFLHSGGNLGDRGIYSERGRRNLIELFPDLPVISLPQTVHFSDTPAGREERARSIAIYERHPRLTVLGRDRESARLAGELFRRARVSSAPDFVLSLPPRAEPRERSGTLLCLRNDSEGVLGAQDRTALSRELGSALEYDTTVSTPIPPEQRAAFLDEALELFAAHEAVVTDRFHGVIFSVLTQTPCVALRTVDHKLTSAIEWFEEVGFVRMAETPADVPKTLAEVKAAPRDRVPEFDARHFAPLADELRRLYV